MTVGVMRNARIKTTLLAGALALGMAAAAPSGALAAAPPFGASTVSITAREQPIGAFLQDLFTQAGLTVVLSPDLKGQVNGAFKGPAERVYGQVARAFNLLTYYDGVAVYVYPATEIASRAVNADISDAPMIQASVRSLGLADPQNQVRISNKMLVATGAKRFLDQVDEIAQRSPPPAAGGTYSGGYGRVAAPEPLQYRVYYLRYGWADDVTMTFSGRQVTLPGVASILRSLMTTGANGAPPLAQRTDSFASGALGGLKGQGLNPAASRDPGTLGFNLASNTMPPATNAAAWNAIGGQGGGGGDLVGAAAGGGADSVRVVADNRLNAVIIRDTRERLAAYDQLIRALDVEPQLVQIDATIIDIDTDKVKDLGAGFSVSDLTGKQQFSLGTAAGQSFVPGPNGGGGVFTGTVTAGDVTFRLGLQALVTKGYAKVVSRPQVLTLSDVEAVFDNSRTFYVRVPGYAASDLYNINAGTTLRVTPHVTRDNGENRMRLLIAIQDGNVSGQTVDRIPIVQNSGINTQALLVEGQSLLLGGLTTNSDTRVQDKVPILGDIPVAGFFFRSTRKESQHTERLFLITPHLISTGAANPLPAASRAPPEFAPQPAPPPGAVVPPPPPPPPTTPPTATTKPTR